MSLMLEFRLVRGRGPKPMAVAVMLARSGFLAASIAAAALPARPVPAEDVEVVLDDAGAPAPEPPDMVLLAQRTDAAEPTGDPPAEEADRSRPGPPAAEAKPDPAKTGRDADAILRRLLPPRSDAASDWEADDGCLLHDPGEPYALAPCIPPPPCDPSRPPQPDDLVGVVGVPTCGPIYGGPCEPRSGRHHHGVLAWCHHLCDRWFDHFYRSK